jgi:hypothetical protein
VTKRKPKAPPPCTCGHRKSAHHSVEGTCLVCFAQCKRGYRPWVPSGDPRDLPAGTVTYTVVSSGFETKRRTH